MIITLKYRRSAKGKNQSRKSDKHTGSELRPTVLETLSIGRRRSISLIQVGDKRMLIGSTPHTINLLRSFPESFFHSSQNDNSGLHGVPANNVKTIVRNMFDVKKESPA